MREPELDELLRRSAPQPSAAATEAAVLLARQLRGVVAGASPLGKRGLSRGWVAAGAALAVLTLTGAGTIAAYQLSIPPFQTTDPGTERTHSGIPVTYQNSFGRQVDCLAFIEFRNLNATQRRAIDDVTHDPQWKGYGQRLLDSLALPNASPEVQNLAIEDAVPADLWHAAQAAVPAMVFMQKSNGPVFTGSSISCAGPGGANGRP